jgi:hypothetical protein
MVTRLEPGLTNIRLGLRGLPGTNALACGHWQTADAKSFITLVPGNAFKFTDGKNPFRAQVGSAAVSPSVDRLPREWVDVAGFEANDAVVDAERKVSGDDAVPDEGPDTFKRSYCGKVGFLPDGRANARWVEMCGANLCQVINW